MKDVVYLIQHLVGYGDGYVARAETFRAAGFVCCRSDRDEDGKYWEVWLGYPFMLKGALHNAAESAILTWIMKQGPGEITVATKRDHYGLSID